MFPHMGLAYCDEDSFTAFFISLKCDEKKMKILILLFK